VIQAGTACGAEVTCHHAACELLVGCEVPGCVWHNVGGRAPADEPSPSANSMVHADAQVPPRRAMGTADALVTAILGGRTELTAERRGDDRRMQHVARGGTAEGEAQHHLPWPSSEMRGRTGRSTALVEVLRLPIDVTRPWPRRCQ
jgi:hypothetical protein